MHRTNVSLDKDSMKRLDDMKQLTGASASEHIRRALAVYAKIVLPKSTAKRVSAEHS